MCWEEVPEWVKDINKRGVGGKCDQYTLYTHAQNSQRKNNWKAIQLVFV